MVGPAQRDGWVDFCVIGKIVTVHERGYETVYGSDQMSIAPVLTLGKIAEVD